jgi:hypothetical protein
MAFFKMRGGRLLFLAGLFPVLSQAEPASFESAHLGPGFFSYTFRRGDVQAVWGFENNSGIIRLYFPGAVAVENPATWSRALDSLGRITWSVPAGPIFLDEPITFTVRSCLNAVTTYSGTSDGLGPYGSIFTTLYELPDYRRSDIVGFQALTYPGPALPVLTIERAGTDMILRGSAVSDGFILEASGGLDTSAQWLRVPTTISNFEFTLQVPAVEGLRFFRLRHPCIP